MDWDFPDFRYAVQVDVTLNRQNDAGRGWRAEVAFPWAGLEWLAGAR
jgi:hypothetical protein